MMLPPDVISGVPEGASFRVGCHLVPLEEAFPHNMPPFNWNMSADCRFALMEGDVLVYHFVDPSVLKGRSYKEATIVDSGVTDPEFGSDVTYVDVDGEVVKMSGLHVSRMIYEFWDVESVTSLILRSAIAAVELGRKFQAGETSPNN